MYSVSRLRVCSYVHIILGLVGGLYTVSLLPCAYCTSSVDLASGKLMKLILRKVLHCFCCHWTISVSSGRLSVSTNLARRRVCEIYSNENMALFCSLTWQQAGEGFLWVGMSLQLQVKMQSCKCNLWKRFVAYATWLLQHCQCNCFHACQATSTPFLCAKFFLHVFCTFVQMEAWSFCIYCLWRSIWSVATNHHTEQVVVNLA